MLRPILLALSVLRATYKTLSTAPWGYPLDSFGCEMTALAAPSNSSASLRQFKAAGSGVALNPVVITLCNDRIHFV
jgi:hypothetical protein